MVERCPECDVEVEGWSEVLDLGQAEPTQRVAIPCGHLVLVPWDDPASDPAHDALAWALRGSTQSLRPAQPPPMYDEKGQRPVRPRPHLSTALAAGLMPSMRGAIAHAVEMQELWAKGRALGLDDDQVADLEHRARDRADRHNSRHVHRTPEQLALLGWRPMTVPEAVRLELELVMRGDPSVRLGTFADELGRLSSHTRRTARLVLLEALTAVGTRLVTPLRRRMCVVCWRWAGRRNLLCRRHRKEYS